MGSTQPFCAPGWRAGLCGVTAGLVRPTARGARCARASSRTRHAAFGGFRWPFRLPGSFLLLPRPQRRAPRAWPARETPLCRSHGRAAPAITYHQFGPVAPHSGWDSPSVPPACALAAHLRAPLCTTLAAALTPAVFTCSLQQAARASVAVALVQRDVGQATALAPPNRPRSVVRPTAAAHVRPRPAFALRAPAPAARASGVCGAASTVAGCSISLWRPASTHLAARCASGSSVSDAVSRRRHGMRRTRLLLSCLIVG